ncbi:ROK family protein [Dysgonomonas sp. Marseille-P4677]|uniref:ROK family protein n=1 Tax=Dysgonomonas sp. Marseille-P4677 TaxID=2364790 RepID=UPI0019124805|nr:ROK family protein [Dysgonomonas sp. Marseille-P4677]MBK5722856.1 ROK family protein [Dysgonomonas sp. Marseille-P4677]
MKIGINISDKNIRAAILRNNSMDFVEESIFEMKRNSNRIIMEKIMRIIRRSAKTRIKGIGLSLPSKLDEKRGIIYDLQKIPYWENHGLKKILEDEFNTRVWINNDVNCFMLAEKNYGICKDIKNALVINLGPNIGTSIMIDGKLFLGNENMFNNADCLSLSCYDYINIYKDNFIKTINELILLQEQFEKDDSSASSLKMWDQLGTLVGRLVSIFLINHKYEIIILGGHLAKSYNKFANSMDSYLERAIQPHILLNLIVITSIIDYPETMGAISLIPSF